MRWNGWGDPAKARPLPDGLRSLLREALGVRGAAPAVPFGGVRTPAPAIGDAVLAALREAAGAGNVLTGDEPRIRHTRGKSTPDLLRMRAGDVSDAPDAVVRPGSHEEVLAVLAACGEHRIAAVPFGGGTSVVGGVTGGRGTVALDLRRLDRLVEVDAESMTVTLEVGLTGPQAESLLGAHGLTIGHFPQSYEYATLGGFAAARSSGQASSGYGRFDEMVMGMRVATPRGTLDVGRAPRSAAGPDLRQLILGSEGALGVITSLRLRVRRRPVTTEFEGWRFDTFRSGAAAVRRLAQKRALPAVLRLADETETMIGGGDGCLMITGYEDGANLDRTRDSLTEGGGIRLGPGPGESWAAGRFEGPYLRDALLAEGAVVETLETAAFWSAIPRLYDAVRLALREALSNTGTDPLIMCHISHVYETGASLYFTVAFAQPDGSAGRWEAAKRRVSAAIVGAGGTISHHHGVGRDHREAYASEIGEVGVEILRAIKERVDPGGILNPGVLIP